MKSIGCENKCFRCQLKKWSIKESDDNEIDMKFAHNATHACGSCQGQHTTTRTKRCWPVSIINSINCVFVVVEILRVDLLTRNNHGRAVFFENEGFMKQLRCLTRFKTKQQILWLAWLILYDHCVQLWSSIISDPRTSTLQSIWFGITEHRSVNKWFVVNLSWYHWTLIHGQMVCS